MAGLYGAGTYGGGTYEEFAVVVSDLAWVSQTLTRIEAWFPWREFNVTLPYTKDDPEEIYLLEELSRFYDIRLGSTLSDPNSYGSGTYGVAELAA